MSVHPIHELPPDEAPKSGENEKSLPPQDAALAIELEWLRNVYQGDHVKQATFRAIAMGAILGCALSLQNLYVGLKTGWALGVAITACVLSYTIYSALVRLSPRLFGAPMTLLENNAMQSTASAAGYSTGGVLVSAITAYVMVNKVHIKPIPLTLWTFFLAVLGTVMAIPMKRQMINIEKLPFPSGIAAAETLRSLHAEGEEADKKSRALGLAALAGAVLSWFRDAHPVDNPTTIPQRVMGTLSRWSNVPEEWTPKWLKFGGIAAAKLTLTFELSLVMLAAGALMGLRTTISMLIAALLNFGVLAPIMIHKGVIADASYKSIVSWSLWIGAPLMVTSGLLTFGLQWRTALRAFRDLGQLFVRKTDAQRASMSDDERRLEEVEVPPSWFAIGVLTSGTGIVITGWWAFGINPFFGVIAIAMAFLLSIVACRATGETDTTPIGAMGKITQLTYGVLKPGNINVNLMAASITANAAGSAADLLTDLKSGYLLGANPRKQFLAQLAGTVFGTACVVPAYYLLVPNADAVGGTRFPAPSAKVWASVAELLAHGVHNLHPTARWGMVIGGTIGLILPLLELAFPKKKMFVPSAMGVGLAFVINGHNSVMMFLGALVAAIWMKWDKVSGERYIVAGASGAIAGEALMGVAVILMASVFGWLAL